MGVDHVKRIARCSAARRSATAAMRSRGPGRPEGRAVEQGGPRDGGPPGSVTSCSSISRLTACAMRSFVHDEERIRSLVVLGLGQEVCRDDPGIGLVVGD